MIRRELPIFIIVGSMTVLVDFSVYRGLLWSGLTPIELAKGVGFVAGTLFAYFVNKFWTFAHKDHASGSVFRFAVLYSLTLAANIYINQLGIKLMQGKSLALVMAFLIATTISAALNFLGMKWFVFSTFTRKVSK